MSPSRAPTLLLYALQLINARNMLRSGVLEEIRLRAPESRVVIVSPLARDPRFVAELQDERTVVEYRPEYTLGAVQARLTSLAIERFVRVHPTRATQIRWQRQENVKAQKNRGLAVRAKAALGNVPLPPRPLLALSDAQVPRAAYDLLEKYRPDVVAIGTAWQITETPWHVGARRLGIPCVAMDLNWDAFESKPGIIRGANELLVWSERMRQRAIHRFGYRPDAVHVTGAPHFDRYFRREGLRPREDFLRDLGFAPATKVVTLAAVAPFNSPHDPERLEVLYEALQAGRFGPNVGLLVRLHPVDSLERWERFRGRPNLAIQSPFGSGPDGGSYEVGESRADMRRQVETLLYTDVLVNVNSTISLEAMFFDTPVVMVAFDGRGGHLPYLQSDARFLDYEHIAALVDTGGVRVAPTPESLVELVADYLRNPSRDRAERQHAADSLYGPRDGQAAARVADHLLRIASR